MRGFPEVAQRVSEEVHAQHGQRQADCRKMNRCEALEMSVRLSAIIRPHFRLRRLHSQAEEAEGAGCQHQVPDAHREDHADRGSNVGQDVAQQDP